MPRSHLLLVLLLSSISAHAQMDQLALLGQWDDNTLAVTGSQNQYNDVWGYVDCAGNEYALLGSREFVHVIGLSAAGVPTEISRIAGTGNVTWRDMKTYGTVAYGVCDSCTEGLLIIDLSGLPAAATLSQRTTQWFNRAHNIYIDVANGRLYAVGTDTRPNGVIVLDIATDPLNPTLLASVNLPGTYIHDIHVVNNIAYASHGNAGLYIYDLSTPATPQFLGSIDTYPQQGYNHSSWLDPARSVLVWADETFDRSVKIADVSDPTDITITDQFRSELLAPTQTGSIAHNPFIRDQYVVLSYYHDGIQIFDISNENAVTQVAGYDTEPSNTSYSGSQGAWGAYPYLPSGHILGSDMARGLFVLDWTQQSFAAASAIGGPASNGPATACSSSSSGAGTGALPVELLAFGGRATTTGVFLDWRTATERNVADFVVEFSPNGRTFAKIGTVAATGNSTVEKRYDFLNANPTGSGYYRLRIRDVDGGEEFSEVVFVEWRSAPSAWSIAPNPVRETVWVRSTVDVSTEVEFQIFDLLGRPQRSGFFRESFTDIDVKTLPVGTYLLVLKSGATEERLRFVRN